MDDSQPSREELMTIELTMEETTQVAQGDLRRLVECTLSYLRARIDGLRSREYDGIYLELNMPESLVEDATIILEEGSLNKAVELALRADNMIREEEELGKREAKIWQW